MADPTPTPSPTPRVHPGTIAAAASALDSFAWPTPPYAAYPASEPWLQPRHCEVVGLNGVSRHCMMVALDPFDRVAHVQVPPSRVTMPLRFSQFQRIVIDEPLATQEADGDEPLLRHRPAVVYRLTLADGTEESGRTVGHIEVNYGLFLFRPLNDEGAVQRVFLPRDAYRQIEIGPQMTDVLLQQHMVTEQQLSQAAKEQQVLRSRKLGDLLVQQKIVSGDDLLMAVEQQSRMPMVRLGEAITALGLVSEEQMREALAQQQTERNLTLGEVLIRTGRLTREDLQLAQAEKLGYPAVDVDSFPVDAQALQRVPAAMARRLNALPLHLRNGRLMVAVEDPMRRSVIEELELVANAKVAPVIAIGERIERRIRELYPELRIEDLPHPTGAPVSPATGSRSRHTQRTPHAGVLRELGRVLHEALTAGARSVHFFGQGDQVVVQRRTAADTQPQAGFAGMAPIRLFSELQGLLEDAGAIESAGVARGWMPLEHWPGLRVDGLSGVRATVLVGPQPLAVLELVSDQADSTLADLGWPEPQLRALSDALHAGRGLVLLACGEPASEARLRQACLHDLTRHARRVWATDDAPLPTTSPVRALPQAGAAADVARAWRDLAAADADAVVVSDPCSWVQGGLLVQSLVQVARRHAVVVVPVVANTPGQALDRLLDLGVGAHDLADALALIISTQTTVRLCPACRQTHPASPAEQAALADLQRRADPLASASDLEQRRQGWPGQAGAPLLGGAPGCSQCCGTGVGGMLDLCATLAPGPGVRSLLREQADAGALDAALDAQAEHHHRLAADALDKVIAGQLDLRMALSLFTPG